MHDGVELTGLALVGLIALAGGLFMARVRQPAIVGYILAGVLLGPSGFQLVEDRESVEVLAELGVLMLLSDGFAFVWGVTVALYALITFSFLGIASTRMLYFAKVRLV